MERTYRRVPCHDVTSRRRRGDTDRIRKTLFVSAHDRRWSRMASRVLKRWGVMVLSMVAVPFAFAHAQAPSATAAEARLSKDFMVGHEQVWMKTGARHPTGRTRGTFRARFSALSRRAR